MTKELATNSDIETFIKAVIYFNPEYKEFNVPYYSNYAFSLRPYSDAEYDFDDVNEENIAPLFKHSQTGFWVNWYKHPGRGLEWSPIYKSTLRDILIDCLKSYRDEVC